LLPITPPSPTVAEAPREGTWILSAATRVELQDDTEYSKALDLRQERGIPSGGRGQAAAVTVSWPIQFSRRGFAS